MFRERIYNIIEVDEKNDLPSRIYDAILVIVIIMGILPLAFRGKYAILEVMDKIALTVFIIDYILRFITADFKVKKGKLSYIIYPFTVMALIDLAAILPSILVINSGFKVLRVLRVFKSLRYSKSMSMIMKVFRRQKSALITVIGMVVGYILISALVIFNIEPDSFGNYFNAVYWATMTLTTIGFGDFVTVSVAGRVITMLSSIMGIAIVALPSGIITAGYMHELARDHKSEELEALANDYGDNFNM